MERITYLAGRALVAASAIAVVGLWIEPAFAQGQLETPAPAATQTGIGLISGWHCTGNVIQVRIDDGELRRAGAGTSRADTVPVCGRADTGFGLLFNYNLLEPGSHQVFAYADGSLFAIGSFDTTSFGIPYLTGESGLYPLLNFPEVGRRTYVEWQEAQQNFSIVRTDDGPGIAGAYYGALVRELDCDGSSRVEHGTFTVGYAASRLSVTAEYADGKTCSFSAPASLGADGYVKARWGKGATATCGDFKADFIVAANGERLTGGTIDVPCGTIRVAAAK